ncbi:hypothetical protein Tco_0223109 [Tanacetum coccineum]
MDHDWGREIQIRVTGEDIVPSHVPRKTTIGRGHERRTWNPWIIYHQPGRNWNIVFQHFELLDDRHAKRALQRKVWDPGLARRDILKQHLEDKVVFQGAGDDMNRYTQKSVKDFTGQLFGTTFSKFSPTPPREPTPPRDESKGKGIATEEPPKDIMRFIEEGGSEMKRWAELKDQEKKSDELMKLLNPATIKAQALKWEEHEEKKAKMLNEFNKCISERTYPLPITKISYVVNSSKTATIRITRDKDPLNLRVYPNFKLKMMGFSEWLEVHALASKKLGKSYDVLLQSLMAKFQWVLNQTKRLGLPPPLELATFGLTAEEKKRKSLEFIKEVFVTEDVRVDGMNRNLIPPPGVVPIDGLVIEEPESGIFFMNRNTNIAFQRESEFHLTPTVQLIRIQNQIRVDSEIANEMFRKMNYVIEQSLKEQRQTYSSQRHHQGSLRSLEDILVSWDGYQLTSDPISWLYKFACKLDTLSSLLVQRGRQGNAKSGLKVKEYELYKETSVTPAALVSVFRSTLNLETKYMAKQIHGSCCSQEANDISGTMNILRRMQAVIVVFSTVVGF